MPHAGRRHLAPPVALLVLVLLCAGCDLPALGALGAGPATSATPAPGPTDSWVIVARGNPSTSPGTDSRRSPSPSPTPGFPPPTAVPTGTAAPGCAGVARPGGQVNGLDVRPGPGSATVTWYNAGERGLLSYRVAAVPQRLREGPQEAVDWRVVPAGAGCRSITYTFSGLTSGAAYVFWLDAQSTRLIGDGTRDAAIGRSGVVTVG